MSPLGLVLRAARLCWAIHALHADVPRPRACAAAVAITLAADEHAPAELLAAIAYPESRFRFDVTNPRTHVCGPAQVKASSSTCARIVAGDELLGYRVAVAKLREARVYCVRRRTPGALCTLAGYRSGPAGVRGHWYRGPRAVLARAARIRRVVERMAPPVRGESGGAS